MGFICCSHGLKKTSKYESTNGWSIRIAFILAQLLSHALLNLLISLQIGLIQAQL